MKAKKKFKSVLNKFFNGLKSILKIMTKNTQV